MSSGNGWEEDGFNAQMIGMSGQDLHKKVLADTEENLFIILCA